MTNGFIIGVAVPLTVAAILGIIKGAMVMYKRQQKRKSDLEDLKENVYYLNKGMQVLIPCTHAIMVKVKTGKVNGEFEDAEKLMREYRDDKTEFKS
jgi:hypothetical protein